MSETRKIVDVVCDVSTLVPFERNPRKHPPEQIEFLAKSMKEFGFTNPVLIDENMQTLGGHGRIEAAKLAGITEVPCRQMFGLKDSQKLKLVIVDNKVGLNSKWDVDNLLFHVGTLEAVGIEAAELGFDATEVAAFKGIGLMGVDEDERAGESLSDVATKIRVEVERGAEVIARSAIEAALNAAGVTYVIR